MGLVLAVLASLVVACGAPRGSRPQPPGPSAAQVAQRPCLAAGNTATETWLVERDLTKGSLIATVSVDRGPPFGIRVVVMRAGEELRSALTGYDGGSEFVNLPPGDYEVVFYYGVLVAERKQITVTAGDHFTSVQGDLHVASFARIPECA
jgi:hypothetical protein